MKPKSVCNYVAALWYCMRPLAPKVPEPRGLVGALQKTGKSPDGTSGEYHRFRHAGQLRKDPQGYGSGGLVRSKSRADLSGCEGSTLHYSGSAQPGAVSWKKQRE